MVFSNSIFLIRFLPAVLLLYFAAPRMLRNAILFVASLIFYAWGEPVYVVLMIFSTVVDYTHGMLVESNLKKGNRARARYFVIESMVINLALLGFFKYGRAGKWQSREKGRTFKVGKGDKKAVFCCRPGRLES